MNALIVQAIARCRYYANYDRLQLDMDNTKMPLNFTIIQNKGDHAPKWACSPLFARMVVPLTHCRV